MRSSPDDDEADGVEFPVGSANTRSNEDEYIVDLDEDISNDDNDDEFISSEDVENSNSESRLKHSYPTTSRSISYEYRTSVRRQNCFFGISVLSLTMAFIATYLLMGLSFTPANIGIFGDESSRKGGSGEVGLDADNAKSQEIVDEEVIEIIGYDEESGDMGQINNSNLPRDKITEEFHVGQDEVGKQPWVENKDWWRKHAPSLDTSNMTPEQKEQFVKMEKKTNHMKKKILQLCRMNPNSDECKKASAMKHNVDLDSIKDELANHYNYDSVGDGKESFPESYIAPPDRNDDGNEYTGASIVKTVSSSFLVLEQVNHDPTSFTQGLSYGDDGTIYETTGLYGQSKVRRINSNTFDVDLSVDVDVKYFGEGSTFFRDLHGNGRLIQITWQEQTGFIYDSETLEKISEFKYTTTPEDGNQGWGITYDADRQEFIVSDGTQYLYFWDRDTLAEMRRVEVTRFDGYEQRQLNELEYMGGLVCCNIWHSDDIICVDPETGKSIREYDMSSLWPANERGGSENVLNGIALGKDHVLLGGKRWNRMYKLQFPDWPTLFPLRTMN